MMALRSAPVVINRLIDSSQDIEINYRATSLLPLLGSLKASWHKTIDLEAILF
ncbi:hypothetical protein [Zooshikella sp. RANM57]|uniref:hypothetical protein n=1 Tax=Zooshikella sp. RANM57 TaxID=3425863 RepID=UPI003D6E1915